MIPGLDSSFDRPNAAQAAAAYAAGVRLWGGYIGTRDGLGLATRWAQADFEVVKQAGMTAIGYASGFDDPIAIRDMAAAWGILPGVDVEPGIRDNGPWVMGWVTAAGAGLYGLASVHYAPGEPIGRGAAWNVVAQYPGFDPGATWIAGLTPPPTPYGWQWQGDHVEFGLHADSMWLTDSFGGLNMAVIDDILTYVVALYEADPSKPDCSTTQLKAGMAQLLARSPATVDVNALATALATHPLTATLSDAERDAVATHVLQHLSKDTAAG